jgi:hypothetical protein
LGLKYLFLVLLTECRHTIGTSFKAVQQAEEKRKTQSKTLLNNPHNMGTFALVF